MDIKQAAEVGRSSFCLKFGVQDLTHYVQVADLLVRLGYKCEINSYELVIEWALDKNEDFWVWDHRREEFRCGRCGHITTTDELGATCPRCGASNGSIAVDVGHAQSLFDKI